MAGRLLPELLDDMTNKSYPFETSYKYPLSTGIFVDMLITTIGVDEHAVLYIRRIVGSTSEILLYVGIHTNGEDIALTDPIVVPKTDITYNSVDFYVYENNINLYGYVTTGIYESLTDVLGDSGDLDKTQLPIYSGCVVAIDNTAIGILVNDIRLTGDVRLIAGDGIKITPVVENNEPYIEISLADFVPAENMEITSDEELLDNITADLGQPITSINGYSPVDGNFVIKGADNDKENSVQLSVTTTSTTDGILEINVPAVTACAVDIQTAAAAFTSSVSSLADRVVALDQFTTALETAVNFLNQQIAQLK